MLLGSNIFPSMVTLKDGRQVQLGDVVRKSFEHSGYTAAEWNGLPEFDRDLLLLHTYYEMRK